MSDSEATHQRESNLKRKKPGITPIRTIEDDDDAATARTLSILLVLPTSDSVNNNEGRYNEDI